MPITMKDKKTFADIIRKRHEVRDKKWADIITKRLDEILTDDFELSENPIGVNPILLIKN